jgi:hypothetical protein
MQQLIIPYLPGMDPQLPPGTVAAKLQALDQYALIHQPWPQYTTDATTRFTIAYTDHGIVLQFGVLEREIRAENKRINSPVYEDSCVEFFIATDEDSYYNFEFNCIGTALGAFGTGKQDRELLGESLVQSINTHSNLHQMENGWYNWRLLVQIPFAVFQYHPQLQWHGLECRGNFYKCGDGLAQPHFVSWTHINAPQPNFHLRQFFGHLHFERQ